MKKTLMLVAIATGGAAIVLAMDPGRFAFDYVDAGGHNLRMFISGNGRPAVVFEAGGSPAWGGPLESWERVQPGVSRFATSVSYDRAGIGFSPAGPKPRDGRQVARELHAALHNAGVAPPYVLVGHSFGGPLIRVFADMYPSDVCGMVLVDPTQEDFLAWYQAREPNHEERHDQDWQDIESTLAETRDARVPSGIPVILITAVGPRVLPDFITEKQRERWETTKVALLKFHGEWVEKLPNGKHVITEDSSHGVPFEEPELIVNSVRQIVEQVRARGQ